MRVPPEIIKATVFVGIETNDRFIPVGTGFLVAIARNSPTFGDAHFVFVATADHVIDMIRGNFIWVRMNRNSGDCSTIRMDKMKRISHRDYSNDISIIQIEYDKGLFDQKYILLDRDLYNKDRANIWLPDIGDEVITVGLYSTHHGMTKNLPVVRVGNIALMPGEPVLSHRGYVVSYLIETKSIAGLSGSPIYLNTPLTRV